MRGRLLIILLLCSPAAMLSQYKDAGLWASYGLSIEPNKKWEFGFAPEIRFNENISEVSTFFTDAGIQYKYSKRFSINATYRIGGRNSDDFYDLRQRVQLGIGLKEKLNDFTLSFQSKWQAAVTNFSAESDVDFVTILRNKFKIQYTGLKKIDLSTSIEAFNLTSQYQPLLFRSWRWVAEIERSFNKRNSLALGYLIQKDILSSPQEMDFVILVTYQMKLNLKKKESSSKEEPVVPAP